MTGRLAVLGGGGAESSGPMLHKAAGVAHFAGTSVVRKPTRRARGLVERFIDAQRSVNFEWTIPMEFQVQPPARCAMQSI